MIKWWKTVALATLVSVMTVGCGSLVTGETQAWCALSEEGVTAYINQTPVDPASDLAPVDRNADGLIDSDEAKAAVDMCFRSTKDDVWAAIRARLLDLIVAAVGRGLAGAAVADGEPDLATPEGRGLDISGYVQDYGN